MTHSLPPPASLGAGRVAQDWGISSIKERTTINEMLRKLRRIELTCFFPLGPQLFNVASSSSWLEQPCSDLLDGVASNSVIMALPVAKEHRGLVHRRRGRCQLPA